MDSDFRISTLGCIIYIYIRRRINRKIGKVVHIKIQIQLLEEQQSSKSPHLPEVLVTQIDIVVAETF